ncbi:MAG: electron transfer flavoprotein subunit alpha/FixB family protein [Planctomycetes bacterium]|nr:electron transfer flavoprotein subunit alpha/FixB family protein [Planctomycetota bacterium]MCC7396815.1 electron transfer flavoprotein subunit alpha/FixB family protein [Planctomycetota bacterium]
MSNIVVIAEVRGGTLKRPSLEAVTAAKQLAAGAGAEVAVVACGAGLDSATAELQQSGAKKVIAIDGPTFANYSGDAWAKAIAEQARSLGATAVLMAHTAMGKDLLPRVAALLDGAIVTDVIEVACTGGTFTAKKPVYGGKVTMAVKATKAPFCATVRPNNFAPAGSGSGAEVSKVAAPAGDLMAVVKEIVGSGGGRTPLQEAKVVVAGGRGLKDAEGFKLLEELAAAFGPGVAAVGASRAVVDSGLRPHREQVGQTGKVVSPPLYFAVGISGAIQHLAGMRTARTIVAINKDADAPIFKVADYGIVGDAFEVLPALTKAIAEAVGHK